MDKISAIIFVVCLVSGVTPAFAQMPSCFNTPVGDVWYTGTVTPNPVEFKLEEPSGVHNEPQTLDNLAAPFETDFSTYRSAVLSDASLPPDEKARRLKTRAETIRCNIFNQRFEEYRRFYARGTIEHSCTKVARTWGKQRCPGGHKCFASPRPGLKVLRWGIYRAQDVDWSILRQFRGGTLQMDGNARVHPDGTGVCAADLEKSTEGAKRYTTIVYMAYPEQTARGMAGNDANAIVARFNSYL